MDIMITRGAFAQGGMLRAYLVQNVRRDMITALEIGGCQACKILSHA